MFDSVSRRSNIVERGLQFDHHKRQSSPSYLRISLGEGFKPFRAFYRILIEKPAMANDESPLQFWHTYRIWE
jgi:hypothetical protein